MSADTIIRYSTDSVDVSREVPVASHRSTQEAGRKRAHPDGYTKCVLTPNRTICAFGVDAFDQMVEWFDHSRIEVRGTREELLECGVAMPYMFDQLGEMLERSGPTEFGDRFTLRRMAKGRYKLTIKNSEEPRTPKWKGDRAAKLPINRILRSMASNT